MVPLYIAIFGIACIAVGFWILSEMQKTRYIHVEDDTLIFLICIITMLCGVSAIVISAKVFLK